MSTLIRTRRGLVTMAVIIVAVAVAVATPAVWTASAFAAWGSPEAVGSGTLNGPFGVAVEESTGDLYVANLLFSGNDKFDAAHELLIPPSPFGGGEVYSGITLNAANGRLYIVDAGAQTVKIVDPASGGTVGEFSIAGSANLYGVYTLVQIGSDAIGNVYVPNAPNNEVQVFNASGEAPAGEVVSTITGEGAHALNGPTGVAVDQSGHIWVSDDGNGRIEEFEPNGSFVKEVPVPGVQSVAVDASGDVFASAVAGEGPHIVEFSSAGMQMQEFGLGTLVNDGFPVSNAVGVDNTRHIVYVSDGNPHDVVWAFTKRPEVMTGGATNVRETAATLSGTVKPNGEETTSCEFEYGTSRQYGHRAPCAQSAAQIGSGASPVGVSAELAALEPYAMYHYRLVAGNAAGRSYGADEFFVPTNEQFGIQTAGPNAFSVIVSNSVVPSGQFILGYPYPYVANPNDLDTQAGSHPFAMTANFRLHTTPLASMTGDEFVKDIAVNLPTGVSGSIVSVPQCAMHDLDNEHVGCPTSSQVGTVVVWRAGGENSAERGLMAPVYNMVPSDGGTAELSFAVGPVAQPVIVKVRTDGDYGIVSITTNISEMIHFDGLTLTLWGDPADPAHDPERFLPLQGAANTGALFSGRRPGNEEGALNEWGKPLPDGTPPSAYLTNPTHCSGPIYASITADSWTNPGRFDPVNGMPDLSDPKWVTATTPMYPEISGCNKLRFNPSIEVSPDTAKANSPSGYQINLHVPQSTNPNDLATPALQNAVATLPQGLAINPGAADGLAACTGNSAEAPGSPGNEIGLKSNVEPACPAASQVGSVELKTPLLPDILRGQIYLASEHEANHYGVYVVIRGDGLLVKLHSTVVANPVTGQLTASFLNNPELPFSDFTMHFYGGPRAVFVNPSVCGSATTTTDLTSWASEPGGLGDMTPSSTFGVSFDGFGSACPTPQPFAPQFAAGTTSIQAGGFSPLTTTFSRPDEDQLVNHVQVTAPPGLLGTLRDVELCPEPQASEGNCPAASKIGHTIIAVGSGAAPLYLPVPGQPEQPVYVTGPYRGAPFGLTFVVPAVAGPYDLGKVIVRAAVNIDPKTAQLTVTSDPLPTIIDGIPVQVKTVNVVIDRPHFIFNPTSCNPMSMLGSVTSLEGSTASLSSPFQVTGCGDLKFKPDFSAFTSAHTSHTGGASLDVRLSFPADALGKEANIQSVKVELPEELPARLSTLQKACPAQTFEANPTACPRASVLGAVKAHSPTLAGELSGPVYFVSHGGVQFPDLVIVLEGEGVRVDLTGTTYISKAGIISTTFKSVPDVPVETFELYLPEGPDSALAANGDLCTEKLVMPTLMSAQNGLKLQQNTPISVQGCTPQIRVLRHRVHGKRAMVSVRVPSAGTLFAGGHGLSSATARAAKAGVVTVTLRLSKADQRLIARHRNRRLMAPVSLSFTPAHGQRLSARVAVLMR